MKSNLKFEPAKKARALSLVFFNSNDFQLRVEFKEEPLDLGGVLTLDLFSTYSNGDPYGNQKIFIVDTETRKYIEAL
jgi:hypothetical protein